MCSPPLVVDNFDCNDYYILTTFLEGRTLVSDYGSYFDSCLHRTSRVTSKGRLAIQPSTGDLLTPK
jgi:hypothetical protein